MPSRSIRVAAAFVAAAALAGTAAAATVTPPPKIEQAGKLVFCSDITYPPEESYQGTKPVGSDIDIGTEVAKLMGVAAQFKNTTFDGIIVALQAKKCDLIISGMNDTADRRKSVDFVDYLKVGQSVMVKKGNPNGIHKVDDLAGHSISVESGTTNKDFLESATKRLQKAGKKPIKIVTFPKDTDAVAALKAGRVDAYFGDSPVVFNYVKLDKSFAVGASPISPIPIGIAVRKHDPLKAAVQKAINALYANGKLRQIVAKWGMTKAVAFLR
jgi:polar amino acid transport system substrate-binding protein